MSTYICNQCDYGVITSAGRDCGMLAVTDTYICKSCKSIVEVCIGIQGEVFPKKEVLAGKIKDEFDLKFYTCPDCSSMDHLVKWQTRKRPCPLCNGKLDEDKDGQMILWD